jgi:hydrogenase maturation protease
MTARLGGIQAERTLPVPDQTYHDSPGAAQPAGQDVKALVIGYGNLLRGDDGVGPRVAGLVQEWKQPGLEAIACHQLSPELAETIVHRNLVIFVDAEQTRTAAGVREQRLWPAEGETVSPHTGSPQALLGLAQALFGTCPPAWLITVPGANFDFGEELSALAEQGMAAALQRIKERFGLL